MGIHNHISFKEVLTGKTSAPQEQGLRYLLAGGLSFTVDFLLLKICTDYLGIYYLLSAVIAYSAGLFVSYTLSIKWIFDRRKFKNPWAEILTFTLIGVVGLGLTSLFMWLFTGICGIYYLVSKVLTTALVTGWNFTAKKVILF